MPRERRLGRRGRQEGGGEATGRRGRRGRRGGGGWRRYKMTQKLVAIGDDFFVEDEGGARVFKIDGKALRVRDTLHVEDLRSGDTYRMKERLLRVKDTMTIQKNGRRAAAVKKALVTPLRDRFTVQVQGGPNLKVQGNILDHEYRIERNGEPVARVSKKWFRVRDSYGIEVSPEMDEGLIITTAVVLDMMAHQGR